MPHDNRLKLTSGLQMKTGILVHGCNLRAENWRFVAWGDPPHQLGRIPQGIVTALRWGAERIVFGTGASRKKFQFGPPELRREMVEAEYSLEYLKLHQDELLLFQPIRDWMETAGADSSKLLGEIVERIELDTESRNTYEEIERAGNVFLNHQLDQIILVSSPTHVVRCLRDATEIFQTHSKLTHFSTSIFANPSITCYEGTRGRDVVVVEPPHRPDRHVVPTHRRIQRMMQLQRLDQQELIHFIEEFDDLLQQYENRCLTMGGGHTPDNPPRS